jgi:hypothetical protein
MGRLVHTGLGSSSLVAHVLQYPPLSPQKNFSRYGRGDSRGGGLLVGTRRRPAAEDGVPPFLQIPPHTHMLTQAVRGGERSIVEDTVALATPWCLA